MNINRIQQLTASFQTLRLVIYLIIALFCGITMTLIAGSLGNDTIEQNVMLDTETDIKNAIKAFRDVALHETPEQVMRYTKQYLTTVMNDEVMWIQPSKGDKVPSEDEAIFLHEFTENNETIDIYINKSYLKEALSKLRIPLLIEGVVATLFVFTLLVVLLEQRRQVQLKHQLETAALNRVLEEQHALVLLGRMTTTLAHELRTPIATLSNLIYAMPSRIADPQFAARFGVLAKEALGRTQQLIDNLLSYGREIVPNEEWISLCDFVGPLAQQFGVHLDCQPVEIYVDRFYLGLLFENLLNNSVQAQAKKITIKGHLQQETGEISYTDDGLGFPEEIQLDELIKPFVTFRPQGAGLGLHLVQKIVAAHGGSLSLHRVEHGAGIKLLLPLSKVKTNEDNK
jgi:signal transduction histidine kinase